MRIERSMHPDFLSNTYLVAGEHTFFVDAGGPVAPLLELAEREGLEPTHVLVTHRHHDHVAELGTIRERWPQIDVLAHPAEELELARPVEPGEVLPGVQALHTPGHTAGMLSFHVEDAVFTGDTLFKGSVGGVLAPGHTTYEDLRRSIMEVLLELPGDTRILPGHTDSSTVADELEHNRFVRIWRGLDPEGEEPCSAFGQEATLILLGDDYDGGHKAWIRWPSGEDTIVPGSQVERS
jgi:hydroxyacylglutathione hydrolase